MLDFDRNRDFDQLYREFKEDKLKGGERGKTRSVVNSRTEEAVERLEDEYGDDPVYNLGTMSFDLLLQMEETI